MIVLGCVLLQEWTGEQGSTYFKVLVKQRHLALDCQAMEKMAYVGRRDGEMA